MAYKPMTIRRAQISAKLDECIVDLFGIEWRKREGVRPSAVAECFKKKYPAHYEQCSAQMTDNYLISLASSRLREGGAILRVAKSRVLILPGLDGSILADLPPLITIPNGKREDIHKPITHAMAWELRAYYKLLDDQLKHDKVRHKAVSYIVEAIKYQPDDFTLTEAWLAAMSAEAARS